MKKAYLEIGKIVGLHGVRGEVKIQPWCDSAAFLCAFSTLYLDAAGENALSVKRLRPHKNIVLGLFDTVDSVEKAQALHGKILYMHRADAHLPDGTNFVQDLLGCKVVDLHTDAVYGVLTEVIAGTNANDIWAVKTPPGETVLMPAIAEVVRETDVDAGIIRICPLVGLFDGKASVIRDAD